MGFNILVSKNLLCFHRMVSNPTKLQVRKQSEFWVFNELTRRILDALWTSPRWTSALQFYHEGPLPSTPSLTPSVENRAHVYFQRSLLKCSDTHVILKVT